MDKNRIAHLALAGMLSGTLAGLGAAAEGDGAKPGGSSRGGDAVDTDRNTFKEVHDCAGLNVCKGLGGCKVTDEKLDKLAKAVAVPREKAGSAHDCAGLNECKGLGGCKVTAEKFQKLKTKRDSKTK
ncbi:MAG: hypothetical protein H0X45_00135 [Planctomycetes bacterium]|nr:hypothetical protein [Nannocystis sp.]MBA3547000.1 hypothetical protein [Nannocystis sp.]MBA3845027.1 hypothetical protein [Planctomycetota bacterium]